LCRWRDSFLKGDFSTRGVFMRKQQSLHLGFFRYGGNVGSSRTIASLLSGSRKVESAKARSFWNQGCYTHLGAISTHLACGTVCSRKFDNLYNCENGGLQKFLTDSQFSYAKASEPLQPSSSKYELK
jgi:hypothetical protein